MLDMYYSKLINKYACMKFNNFVIPDLIMIKEGIACGDRIVLKGQIDDEMVSFDFSTISTCLLSKAMCNYITFNFNNKSIDYINTQVKHILNKTYKDKKYLFDIFELNINYYEHRYECLLSPIKLFSDFTNRISNISFDDINNVSNDISSAMECDACIGACAMNWRSKQYIKLPSFRTEETTSIAYLKSWLPLGKVVLNDEEKKKLQINCGNMNSNDYRFLQKNKLDGFIFNHLINNKNILNPIDKRWVNTAYRIYKNYVAKAYIEKIKKFIINESLDIYFIKGYITKKYYANPNSRIQSDYDVVSTSCSDAFKLARYLLNNGFRIYYDLFSIKTVKYEEKNVLSGHFHMQKLVEDKFLLEMDISFPAYPINKVGLFYPMHSNNEILPEDQIVITILHIFKHHKVYIKDINDLYYMLRRKDIDLKYLNKLISKNRLYQFFELAVVFIYFNYCYEPYDQKAIKRVIDYFKLNRNVLNDYYMWPYDLKMHLKIKRQDYIERSASNLEQERVYLFPVVMFQDEFDFSVLNKANSEYKIEQLDVSIYKVTYAKFAFFITSIGIFICNKIETNAISRKEIISILQNFKSDFNIKNEQDIPYSPFLKNFY